jgi:hypothetical protein
MPAPLRGDALSDALNGYPVYLGTVDATTTSKTNAQASSAFANSGDALRGKVLMIQNAGSVSIRIHPVSSSTGTVANARGTGFGPEIQPGERVYIRMGETYPYLAVIATSSTASVDFWEMI